MRNRILADRTGEHHTQSTMTIKCPKCGTKINAAKLFASKGGSATGPTKARTPEQARAAAMVRWAKKGKTK